METYAREMGYLLILFACGFTLALEDEQLYCGPRYTHLCTGKGQHVACQFPVAGSGPNCMNYSRVRFTGELRNVITHFINKRRQRIAAGHERVRGGKHIPTPQVMMFVEWDFELARLAQRLADQCYFVHDACRATVRYPYAGQAVGEVRWRHLSNNYELSAQRAIRRVFDAWWGERRRVEVRQLVSPFRINDKGLSLTWGHFSQLAIWTLRAVGCGAVRHGEDYPRLLLVCDFSHTNMLGEKTLIPGETAQCPEHTRRKTRSSFPLLCAPVKEQIIKHSRVVEEDVLDESDYDDEEPNPMTAIRDEMRIIRLMGVGSSEEATGRYNNRGHKRVKATEETESEETTTPFTDEPESNVEETEYTTVSPKTTKMRKKLKINLKPNQDRTPMEAYKKVVIDYEEEVLSEKSSTIDSRVTGFYDLRERLPSDIREEISEDEDVDIQETHILTKTSPPFLVETKQQADKIDRLRNRVGPSTEGSNNLPKVIKSNYMQYNARHRWKPERERPARPGASALLHPEQQSPPTQVKQDPAIPPRISFNMDDDEIEQLHADTGFRPNWKNETIAAM